MNSFLLDMALLFLILTIPYVLIFYCITNLGAIAAGHDMEIRMHNKYIFKSANQTGMLNAATTWI